MKVEKRDWVALLVYLKGFSWANRGIISRLTLSELLETVAKHDDFGEDQQQELQAEVKNMKNVENLNDDARGNEWDELVLDDLDPEGKAEFGHVHEAVLLKRAQDTNCQWQIVQKALQEGTKRGRPKAKAKAKFSTKWIRKCKRASPWKNETSSKRQCLKGDDMKNNGAVPSQGAVPGESLVVSNGAVPGESAVISNGGVPGESAVLSGAVPGEGAVLSGAVPGESAVLSGAVPGESAVPSIAVPSESLDLSDPSGDVAAEVASESGEPGASRSRTTKHVSPKGFYTPAILQKLAPPHCTFILDQKAHRFTFKFKKAGDVWKKHYDHPLQMSKAFKNKFWKDALKEVHTKLGAGGTLSKSKLDGKSQIHHVSKPQGAFPKTSLKHLLMSLNRCLQMPMQRSDFIDNMPHA